MISSSALWTTNMLRLAATIATRRVAQAPARRVATMTAMPPAPVRPSSSSLRGFATDTKVHFAFVDGEGTRTEVAAAPGQTLLDVAHENDIELEGACGGELACSTCHLIFEKAVYDQLPEVSEEEEDMLDLAWGLTDTSRLGCQIKVSPDLEGTTIRVPDESDNLM